MNIALVSPYDYAYPGGVSTHISHLAHQFSKMEHRVRIFAPCSSKKVITEDIIPLGRTVPWSSNGSVARITLSWRLMPKVNSILEKERFDIIHVHEPFCPMLPWMVLLQSNSVNVATFHSYYERSLGYRIGKPIVLDRLYKRLIGKIAVSRPAMECISRYFPGDDYRVIPHGIELERFSLDVPPIKDFCDGKLNILFVGRLEKRKGVDWLLRAYQKVKGEFASSRLIVVGPGDGRRRDYEKWVNERNLADVVFTGYLSDLSLIRYYRTADIFCAPAIGKESFGIVLLEAMAAGKPIIASNIEGYANVLSHNVEGLLVPPKDDEAIAQALALLINNETLRHEMGDRGRRKAEEHGWDRIAKRTVDYYLELLNKGNK